MRKNGIIKSLIIIILLITPIALFFNEIGKTIDEREYVAYKEGFADGAVYAAQCEYAFEGYAECFDGEVVMTVKVDSEFPNNPGCISYVLFSEEGLLMNQKQLEDLRDEAKEKFGDDVHVYQTINGVIHYERKH